MATHVEMKRLADDAGAASGLARFLMTVPDADWTEWEVDFLENIARHRGPEPLSLRQTEVLVELRAKGEKLVAIEGLSIKRLIGECWLARLDLDDDALEFLTNVRETGRERLSRRAAHRLLAIYRRLQAD